MFKSWVSGGHALNSETNQKMSHMIFDVEDLNPIQQILIFDAYNDRGFFFCTNNIIYIKNKKMRLVSQ